MSVIFSSAMVVVQQWLQELWSRTSSQPMKHHLLIWFWLRDLQGWQSHSMCSVSIEKESDTLDPFFKHILLNANWCMSLMCLCTSTVAGVNAAHIMVSISEHVLVCLWTEVLTIDTYTHAVIVILKFTLVNNIHSQYRQGYRMMHTARGLWVGPLCFQ